MGILLLWVESQQCKIYNRGGSNGQLPTISKPIILEFIFIDWIYQILTAVGA